VRQSAPTAHADQIVHADLMVHAARVTLRALRVGVLDPDATGRPVLTEVPGRHAIENLARSAMMPLATMTRWLTPMRYQQSSTVLHGAS
jgi:hypothetical protein